MIRTIRLAFLLICAPLALQAAPPQLTPADVQEKLGEILEAHATHQKLDPVLIERTMTNYVDILDPSKTYLTESEVAEWLSPQSDQVDTILAGYKKGEFPDFYDLHNLMVKAVKRRNRIEEKLTELPDVSTVDRKKFKDLEWAKDEAELSQRLAELRALQIDASAKFNDESQEKVLKRLKKRRSRVESRIVGNSAKEQKQIVLANVLKATVSALDSQTAYFTPEEAYEVVQQVQQRLFGIGVRMSDNLDGFNIVQIVEGGPAHTQGKLRAKDRIVAVNGKNVVGFDIVDAVQLIRGKADTPVTLTILRDVVVDEEKVEKTLDVTVIRGEVVVEETRFDSSYEPFGDGVIGRIALHSFYHDQNTSAAADVEKAIKELKEEHNLKGVILDLRHNAGGLLEQGIAVTGLFITKGIVASVKDNTNKVRHLRDVSGTTAWDGPLIVLVSRGSASASEIVAQSLQDYGRALIVGDATTFGKGTFQVVTIDTMNGQNISPKGEYKVTRGAYYTVSGKSPQLHGVIPEVVVPGIYSELEIGEQFTKFPLEAEDLKANFQDDLADIPFLHRIDAIRTYRFNLQPQLDTYTPYLARLQENSQIRLEKDKDYQFFISVLKGETDEDVTVGQNDFQLNETYNVMRDLIYLLESNQKQTAAVAA